MDWIGPREIIVFIGFLTILAIVLDVMRRVKRNRYEKLQMSSKVLNRNAMAADGFTDDLDQSQFPSGGSKVIGTRALDSQGFDTKSPDKYSTEIDFDNSQKQQNFDLDNSIFASENRTEIGVGSDDLTQKIDLEPDSQAGDVLVIHLMPREGTEIDGKELLEAAGNNDLRFGEMQIFNKYSDVDGSGDVLFSMANLVNPGTFDLSTIREITIPGVTIFLVLDSQVDPLKSFDIMLSVVNNLANALSLKIMDDTRSTLTPQTADHYRQRAKAAMR